jgi:hypothetical protein
MNIRKELSWMNWTKLGNIEWFAVAAMVIAIICIWAYLADAITYEEATVMLLGSIVTAVLSLRSR